MKIEGVEVMAEEGMSLAEIKNYIEYVKYRLAKPLKRLKIKLSEDGKVDLNYEVQNQPFARVRRITGYLTGDLMTWNNAKRAEERERVKHAG